MFFAGQHYFRVSYEYRKVFALIGVASAVVGAGIFIDRGVSSWSSRLLAPKGLMVAAYVGSLFAFRILKFSYFRTAYGMVRGKLRGRSREA
jgi:hypothetical protein